MEHDIRLATVADLAAVETIVQSAYSHYVERIGRKLGPMNPGDDQIAAANSVTSGAAAIC